MSDDRETPTGASAYTSDFELPRHDVIHEDNWPEYQARGFRPVRDVRKDEPETIDYIQSVYGVEHVYTGDAYSYDEDRPLRNKPGMTIYVSPEGRKQGAEDAQWWRDYHERERQQHEESPEQPPSTSR
jgi:hypothetical protein